MQEMAARGILLRILRIPSYSIYNSSQPVCDSEAVLSIILYVTY